MENHSKKTTQIIELEEFFQIIKYDYEQDLKKIKEICKLTKTRPKDVPQDFFMDYGSEQPFLIKSIINKLTAENFFEIGTGRGTGSYSVALEKSINFIATLDMIPHFIDKIQQLNLNQSKYLKKVFMT